MTDGDVEGEQERYDRMLLVGARTIVLIIPLYLAISPFFVQQPDYLYWAMGVGWASSALGLVARRLGAHAWARWFILATMLGSVPVLMLAGGPSSSHVGAAFPAIAGSAFLLKIRVTIGTALWFSLIFCISLILDQQGYYPERPPLDPLAYLTNLGAVCVFVCSVLWTYQLALAKLTKQQAELNRREGEAAALVLNSPDGIAVIDARGLVRSINPALAHWLGEDSPVAEDSPALDLALDDEGRRALEGLLVAEGGSAEFRLARNTPPNLIVSVNAQRFSGRHLEHCVQLTLRNVTHEHEEHEERLRLERRLRQSEKMENLGKFAGGVAHDFNNLLTSVMGHAEFVEELLEDESFDRAMISENLKGVLDAAKRGADITSTLLSFSRLEGNELHVVDVAKTLAGFEPNLRRMLPEDVELTWHYEDELFVRVSLRAVEQIVMNLVTNSQEAMPEGGSIRVECSERKLIEPLRLEHETLPAGDYVRIAVSDSGAGMSPEVRERALEPFFSTRSPGAGTGLGLATVQGLASRAGGAVCVDSEEGRGTVVTVYLQQVADGPESPREDSSTQPLSGEESLLVCEDERRILSILRRTLERQGYRVFGFDNPHAALAAVVDGLVQPRLLLTDVIMPGMNGRLLAERVVAASPHTSVLFMSGHTDGILEERGVNRETIALLSKPFSSKELLRAVRRCLDATSETPESGSGARV